ncbi:MAG: replication initiation protein [Fusobacterium periodonticum]|nr:replication initiation protein [Fusobacterium periodonticum]
MKKKNNTSKGKNQVLIYHNDFNFLILAGLKKNELSCFMSICYKVMGKGTDTVTFTFEELAKISDFKRNINTEEFEKLILETNAKLQTKVYSFKEVLDSGKIKTTQFVLFTTFTTNPDTKTVTVEVHRNFVKLLNTFNENFTEVDLKKFVTLKSKYSQLIYKELMQYKSSGYRIIKIDELVEKLNIPSSYYTINEKGEITYRINILSSRILDKVKEELAGKLEDFNYEFKSLNREKKKGRKKYTHIEFTFKPIRESIQNQNKDIEVAEVVEKNNVNNAIDEVSKSLLEKATEIKGNDTLSKEERKEKLLKMLRENLELLEKETEEIEETNENTDTITKKINEFSNYWQLTNKHKEILLSLTNKFSSEEIERELERISAETEKRAEIDRLGYVKACVNNAEKEIAKRKKAEKKAKAVAEAEVEVVEKITEDETIDNIDNFLGKYKI